MVKEVCAHDEKGVKTHPREVIFPIFKVDNKNCYHLIGTGFYIADNGIMVTAKHVIEDAIKSNLSLETLHFEGENWVLRKVDFFTLHSDADIAIVHLKGLIFKKSGLPLINSKLKIGYCKPKEGDHLYTYAYPKTSVAYEDIQRFNVVPTTFDGYVSDAYPNGRDRVMLPSACYLVQMDIKGGASGGPVMDSSGAVVAINSTSFNYPNDDIGTTFVSCFQDVLEMDFNSSAPEERSLEPLKLGTVIE
jgi:hypothetical protein